MADINLARTMEEFQRMQQTPPFVTQPSFRKQYLIRGLVYSLVGAALLGLAWYLNSLDTSNIFTTGVQNTAEMNMFGCLSGLVFIAGVIILFIPILLFQTYRRKLAASPTLGTREEETRAARKSGEVSTFLGGVAAVLGWIIGWGRFNRLMALAGFVTFVGFFGIARGLMNLNLMIIGVGIGVTLLGLLIRVIVGGL